MVLPAACAARVKEAAPAVSYGWGMVPVEATIGATRFRTALFPKDGTYYLPLKDAVRRQADLAVDDHVAVALVVSEAGRWSGKA